MKVAALVTIAILAAVSAAQAAEIDPQANIGLQGMVSFRPQGDYCAVASYGGTTIRIIDLTSFPEGPFPVSDSFGTVRSVYDIDWGPNGIVAVGDNGSVAWIEETSGPSWTVKYSHYNMTPYGMRDFDSVSVIDSQYAVIGGKGRPNPPHQDYPVLFKWLYSSAQGSLSFEYVTEGVFDQYSRVWSVCASDGWFAACERSGDRPWVAVWDLDDPQAVDRVRLSDEVDDVFDVACSETGGYIVTCGLSGSSDFRSNNARLQFTGAALIDLGEFDSCLLEAGIGAGVLTHADRPLGIVATTGRVAVAYLDDNAEPFAATGGGCSIWHSVAVNQTRGLVLVGNGDLYHLGHGPLLDVPDLVPGQSANLTVSNATPYKKVVLAYSLTGSGPVMTAYGIAYLSPPIRKRPGVVADSSGIAVIPVTVPPGATGKAVSLQAVDLNSARLSNSVKTIVR